MKINELKNKHDHALTKWLKVIIFSMLMVAPLLASVSQWIYVCCNRHAKESYSAKFIETKQEINNISTFVQNENYYLQPDITTTGGNVLSYTYNYNLININWEDYGAQEHTYNAFKLLRLGDNSIYYIWLYDTNNNRYQISIQNTNMPEIVFNLNSVNADGGTLLGGYIYTYIMQTETLDNAFYYGVDQMTKSDLFNWTQNTAIYTGIKGMTDNLEIGTPAIAILITYWTILTIAYVIIDILLTGFTWLTHLIVRND